MRVGTMERKVLYADTAFSKVYDGVHIPGAIPPRQYSPCQINNAK